MKIKGLMLDTGYRMPDKKLCNSLFLFDKNKLLSQRKKLSGIRNLAFGILLIGLTFFLLTPHLSKAAASPTLPEILQLMEEAQKKVSSFRARFIQTKTVYLLEGAVKSQGELYFQRPGRLYWETKDPNRLVLVINDNTLWLYYPDLKEADKMDITLLRGLINKYVGIGQSIEVLKTQYDIKLVEANNQVIILDLSPKSPRLRSQVKSLRLWINPATWFPKEVKHTETNGDTTDIVFLNFDVNISIPENKFVFTPPRGVKVKDMGAMEIPGDSRQ